MKDEEKALLREASAGLRLHDLVLLEARLSRPMGHESLAWQGDGIQQQKRAVRFARGKGTIAQAEQDIAQFEVELGTRVVDTDDESKQKVIVEIEARFIVIYAATAGLSDESLELFAKWNAVHIVWPFWRQHVFDLIGRAQLPKLQVPLLSGINS